ncbi:MAG: hypothetical protein V4664_00275 [Patescibacteria group bacterium]
MNGINEFTAKKLGEVVAFARLGTETSKKGLAAFTSIMSAEEIKDMQDTNDRHERSLFLMAEEFGVADIVEKKADVTTDKLRAMRDMYVKDQWDNSAEISEWSGFFEGAAIVHWALVEGAAEGGRHESLRILAADAKAYHENKLKMFESFLKTIGIAKTTL